MSTGPGSGDGPGLGLGFSSHAPPSFPPFPILSLQAATVTQRGAKM